LHTSSEYGALYESCEVYSLSPAGSHFRMINVTLLRKQGGFRR
jgi:hypothetical protein